MPIAYPSRELEVNILDWLFNSGPQVLTAHGVLIDGTQAEMEALIAQPSLSIQQILAYELPENTAIAYSRTSVKAGSAVPIVFDSVEDNRSEVSRIVFSTTITPGQLWPYYGISVLARSRPWANRTIASVTPGTDVITFPQIGTTTFTVGDRVIVTADAGATLPGGVTPLQVYTLQSVSIATGVVSAKLRVLGGATDLDITTTGSGTLRLRSVDGFFASLVFEGTGSIGAPVLVRQQASGVIQFGIDGGMQAIA